MNDRESDRYAKWARVPGPAFHVLTRAMHDRSIKGGSKLSTASLQSAGQADIDLRDRTGRAARTVHLAARFGQVTLKRTENTLEKNLSKTVQSAWWR